VSGLGRALERQSEPLALGSPVVKRRICARVLQIFVQRAAENHLQMIRLLLGINQESETSRVDRRGREVRITAHLKV